MNDTEAPAELVAVDLGSNSFHMVVARLAGGQIQLIDRLRERVALAEGLDEERNLTAAAQQRGLACLERFAQRLRPMNAPRVRAVGTNTLRRARNARAFLQAGAQALGWPIEIISGHEEARLIYLGVSHDLSDEAGRRLVVDIGGGSTECILGERFEPIRTESLHMGCITYSQRFFPDGRLTRQAFKDASTAAQVELEPIKLAYRRMGWVDAVGSSGTITAIDEILRLNGWGTEGITIDGLRRIRDELIQFGRSAKVVLPGLPDDRTHVLPGGLAILHAVFKSLRVERMRASSWALREGLLYDTLGRIQHEDVRDRTIVRITERYGIDREHALRVEATALALFDQVAPAWGLGDPEVRETLSWACRLHEVGLTVSFSSFHVHGAYLLAHSDMPGFSREQQAFLAVLVGAHRRRIKPDRLEALRAAGGESAAKLAALLRLATTLNRGRDPSPLPPIVARASGNTLELQLGAAWLAEHPMTDADLLMQTQALLAAGLQLRVS